MSIVSVKHSHSAILCKRKNQHAHDAVHMPLREFFEASSCFERLHHPLVEVVLVLIQQRWCARRTGKEKEERKKEKNSAMPCGHCAELSL
mgnify:CR=1 FL=1